MSNDSDEYDSPSDDDDLHFKAQLRNPPILGEPNAESAERKKRIEEEVEQMKKQGNAIGDDNTTKPIHSKQG
jgi:hypothetical protein